MYAYKAGLDEYRGGDHSMPQQLKSLHGIPEDMYVATCSVSPFGTFRVFWKETNAGSKIQRIVLPGEALEDDWLSAGKRQIRTSPAILQTIREMEHFLKGHDVPLDLTILALEQCPRFQQHVLLAEYGIPRGWVSTYGRIARHIGVPQGARAVGHALATNAFPIIIPCHRAIKSDGRLGGFRDGQEMKRRLLELEGIRFSPSGKMPVDRIYY